MVTRSVKDVASGETLEVELEKDECIYCHTACEHITFDGVGTSVFLEVDGHIHQVYYCGETPTGESVFTCQCVPRWHAEKAITDVRNRTN